MTSPPDPSPRRAAIACFDVFDTTISRRYATPGDVFEHLGELLAEVMLIPPSARFADARLRAEAEAWRRRGGKKGAAIDEIYAILAAAFGWDGERTRRAMEEEIRLEREGSRPVPDMVRLINEARRSGQDVCFVSDMHLRVPDIVRMLGDAGAFQTGDRLLVSSELAAIKSTGGLFRRLLSESGVSRKRVRHIGDDRRADIRGARRVGLSAGLYDRAVLNRFEQLTLDALGSAGWKERSVAAVSKFTRLSLAADDAEASRWDLLSSTIAPFVAGYALWVLDAAQRQGIERLYFLSRDMRIVHEVASFFAQKRETAVRCEYLHASRAAWQPAGYSGANEFELSWLAPTPKGGNPEQVLSRLLSGRSETELDRLLGPGPQRRIAQPREVLKDLLMSPAVREAVASSTGRRRRRLLEYLAQNGYRPERSCAFVDSGWRGTLQRSLAQAYDLEGERCEIDSFYIGRKDIGFNDRRLHFSAYLEDEVVASRGYALVALIESLLSADHGMVVDFSVSGAAVEPVLRARPIGQSSRQFELVRRCCLAYATQLASSPAWDGAVPAVAPALAAPLLALCANPSRQEAAPLSNWVYDDGRDLTFLRKIAQPLTLGELGKLVAAGLRAQPLSQAKLSHPWVLGSVALSSPVRRTLAQLAIRSSEADLR